MKPHQDTRHNYQVRQIFQKKELKKWEHRVAHSVIATVVFGVFKLIAGMMSGSYALVADGIHNILDLSRFLINKSLLRFEQQLRDSGFYPNYIGSWMSIVLYVMFAFLITRHGFDRLLNPIEINAMMMLAFAAIGMMGNFLAARYLNSRKQRSSDHIHVYQKLVSNVVSSFFVVVVASIVLITGWNEADTILSLSIGVFLVLQAALVFKNWLVELLERPVDNLNSVEVAALICQDEAIIEAHSIKTWTTSLGQRCLSVHIVVGADAIAVMDAIRSRVRNRLWRRYSVEWVKLTYEVARSEASGALSGLIFEDVQLN